VALHTNNNTTRKSVAPQCYAYQQQDHDTTMTKRNKEKKKGKKLPIKAFPLTPRGSLIAHGKRNG
jgi:hypothetical protein